MSSFFSINFFVFTIKVRWVQCLNLNIFQNIFHRTKKVIQVWKTQAHWKRKKLFFFFFAKLQKHTYTYNSLQLKWTLIAVKHQHFLFLLMQINNLMQM